MASVQRVFTELMWEISSDVSSGYESEHKVIPWDIHEIEAPKTSTAGKIWIQSRITRRCSYPYHSYPKRERINNPPYITYLKLLRRSTFIQQTLDSLQQIIFQILPMLQAHADSQQSPIYRCITHGSPFDKALDASKGRCMME